MAVRGVHQHKAISVLAEDEASPSVVSLEQYLDPIPVKAECASASKSASVSKTGLHATGPIFIKVPVLPSHVSHRNSWIYCM